ncbi:class II aldolase/adducin family protein [Thiothrix lacustris]|uniref:Class II aldolase/adducin family protein n=1 Tax=Thiothrix lacustris TaxID=525917 RepID=A0ABY9MR04_9GAMM|nr:class II aldolase/adducin family protein [Thiothrix lacustris]WML90978.1 class II aldolase/adducin family protein [Thiothrix lacustris]
MYTPEAEGVIKFTLSYTPSIVDVDFPGLQILNQCRQSLWQWGVIGQDADRYAGLGYGNLSMRTVMAMYPDAFMITGTQTGHLPILTAQHYAQVLAYDLGRHDLHASGASKPSSEAMTHAALYQCVPAAQAIIHGHHPAIWRQAQALGLVCTSADIPYGTPQMAQAMQAVLRDVSPSRQTIVMLGHEDGFITWGDNLAEAVALVRQLLQDAAD